MNIAPATVSPLACIADAIPAAGRPAHFTRLRRLFSAPVLLEKQRLANGYAFRFAADEVAELGQFIALERKCCPFLTFVLEVRDSASLRIHGPDGTPEFLELEFRL